ncbi:UDP-N-acetylmuramate dehydrogenase [Jiangella mangrovi]|uniref:UDP-N-acetylenolpyruvoylglucosamine reductase n=1 Tax=Jiangella mangrovi TaxID=1524084 RepID=A0A7W9GQB8_9ACTN|nr:UDP-N-acetylmuramate dehydrogenase [Jiangella mangrovi]
MRETFDVPLAGLTTLRLGGPAKRVVEATTEAELIALVRDGDERGEPVLLVGGGSNLVIGDSGFDGTAVRVATRGIDVDASASCDSDALAACGGVLLTAAAGEPWDDLVAYTVANEWPGLEALSGIPGLVGATPMQNVGAYGQEVRQTVWQVRTYDRQDRRVRTFANADCGFAYRDSRFKGTDRYVILTVSYQLREGSLGMPVAYAELARRLGVEVGGRAPLASVRAAVLALRAGKGMVLDAGDHDTWSAGSFFTNPVLTEAQAAALPADAPRFPAGDGLVKSSAAWLIERAGFGRGYSGGRGGVSLSTKHTLALTNRGEASTADLLGLAREVRDGVRSAFGVELAPEPTLVGCTL